MIGGTLSWLRSRADDMAAAMLAAIFAVFLLQIGSRYLSTNAIGWTVELSLTIWIWLVFWASAFCLKDRDHVKFDILYLSVNQRFKRLFAFFAATAILIGMAASLPATLDYITFYKIKKSAILRWRLDLVYSIYGVFAIAIIVRYAWIIIQLLRGNHPDDEPVGQPNGNTSGGDGQ